MSSSQTSHSTDEGPLVYEAVGFASIEIVVGGDGVSLVANADGLLSLARLLKEMAERSAPTSHIYLTPAMQLTQTSLGFVVARKEGGVLPDGSPTP